MAKRPQRDSATQSRRFIEAAREHGCDDADTNDVGTDELMKRLAAQKRHPENLKAGDK